MQIKRFRIQNFKGIARTSIDLMNGQPGNITMLVGLNESGKTTILEALSNFVSADSATAHLVGTVSKRENVEAFIPKDQKAAFSGSVVISAEVAIDDEDQRMLSAFLLDQHNLILNRETIAKSITVSKMHNFEDSMFKRSSNVWSLTFSARKAASRRFEHFTGEESTGEISQNVWRSAMQYMSGRLPKIVYFPTFLFDFPARIYLEGDISEINNYYREILEDILRSLPGKLSIRNHIIDRLNRVRASVADSRSLLAILFQRDEKKQIDAVFHAMSQKMTSSVLGGWKQILGKSYQNKRIHIDWGLEPTKDNAIYIEISIIEGASKYYLSDRSLGFRWFFSFILFTQFRNAQSGNQSTIFLFDEPASNLHSRAQMKLLESFARIACDSTYVVYSTHSHYMINPLWLERAYIVENKAFDMDETDEIEFSENGRTAIEAVLYRRYLGSYPNKTTYFQPILDSLNVAFSPLVRASNALIVEGKYDYHPVVYFKNRGLPENSVEVFPGGGAGNAGELISLFRGWGVKLRIILDDDKAGRQAKAKYQDQYLLTDSEVVTIGEISGELKNKSFESIYKDDLKNVLKEKYLTSDLTKKHFGLFFQELNTTENNIELPQTSDAFKPILMWIQQEFNK